MIWWVQQSFWIDWSDLEHGWSQPSAGFTESGPRNLCDGKRLSDVRDQRSGCKGQITTGYRKDLCIASVNEQCLKPCVRLHHESQTDVRPSDVYEDNVSRHEVHAVHWQNTQSSVLWATRVVLQICHFKCPLCNNQKPLAIAIAIKGE